MNRFHNAALRLTLWYLGLIMVVSIACSVALYQVAADGIIHSARRQIDFYSQVLAPEELASYSKLRLAQQNQDILRLKDRLIVFNLAIFVGGGLASYGLARRTMRPLEQSLRAQERFTSDASHELRTPLSVMQTELETTLRDKNVSKSQLQTMLRSTLDEVKRLQSLSENLLKLAEGTSRHDINQVVSLGKVVEVATKASQRTAKNYRINIETSNKAVGVRGNFELLAELVSLLLDNAIKYSPDGGTVVVESGQGGKLAFVKVLDKGVGMSADDLPKIFDRFYRIDQSRTKSVVEGYGLGLSIAKNIAQLHDGYIEVSSYPGKGSAFTLKLPAIKSQPRPKK